MDHLLIPKEFVSKEIMVGIGRVLYSLTDLHNQTCGLETTKITQTGDFS